MRRRQVSRTQTTSLARRFAPVTSKKYFLPSSLPGCQLWLDAADSSSVITTGTNVTTWNDKSGNGYHMNTLTQSATWTGTAVYPTIGTSINGLQTVNFKAQAGLKQGTTLDGVKNLFWVGRIEAPVGSGDVSFFLFGHDTHYDWHSNQYGGRIVHPSLTQTGIYNASPTSLFTSDVNAITNASFSSVNMPSAPNVSLLSVGGITGTTRYQGICYDRNANLGWCGDLAEVITFSTALSTAQRQAVEGYLAHKWGLTKYYSPTTPLSISGCQLWLDAADSTTVTGTTTVTQWRDKSVNNRHLGVRVGGTTYSSNAINLVNSAMFVDSPVNLSNVTMFILAKTTGGNNQTVFTTKSSVSQSYNTLDGFGFYMDGTTSVRLYGQYGGGVPSFATNTSTPKLFSYQSSGTSISVWMNAISQVGATLSSSRTSTAGGFGIGAEWTNEDGGRFQNFYVNASIYEIIVYNTVLTITQRETIEKYLMQKWGLGLLPLSHPYNNFIPAPTVFIPPSFAQGCSLWLDAADSSTITGTTSVTAWRDKSVNGYVANSFVNSVPNPSSVSNIQNGNGVIQYSAGNGSSIANFVLAQTMSIFKVYYPINQSAGSPFIEQGPNAGSESGFFFHAQDGNNFYIKAGSIGLANFGTTTVSNTWQMIEGINPDPANGNTMAFYVNGITKASGGTQSDTTTVTKTLYINGRAGTGNVSYNTYLAELIIYNTALTTSQRTQVEGYLAWKWGLQSTLPSTHLYKSITPIFNVTFNPFIPTLIPGCQLWLDAADQTSMTLSGSNVTQWRDKSGNGNNSTSSSATYTTGINGLGSMNNPTISGPITNSGSSTVTIFVVASNNRTGNSYDNMIALNVSPVTNYYASGSLFIARHGDITNPQVFYAFMNGFPNGDLSFSFNRPFNTPFIFNIFQSGTVGSTYGNGTSYGDVNTRGATFNYTNYYIGAVGGAPAWLGNIGEILVYNTALTTTQRQQVESYLAWKWALQTSLPSDHNYKFAPPSV